LKKWYEKITRGRYRVQKLCPPKNGVYVKGYCWANLADNDINLGHYSTLPYFLGAIVVLMATSRLIWETGHAQNIPKST